MIEENLPRLTSNIERLIAALEIYNSNFYQLTIHMQNIDANLGNLAGSLHFLEHIQSNLNSLQQVLIDTQTIVSSHPANVLKTL